MRLSLICMLICVIGNAVETAEPGALGVQESRALALAPLTSGIPWGAYATLPKAAREALVEILGNPDPPKQANSIRMLGYVGNNADIERIIRMVEADEGWNPAVGGMDKMVFAAVVDCIGVTARRADAPMTLDRAMRLAKAADVPRTAWYPADVLESKPGALLEPLVYLVEGYALSNDQKGTDQLAGIVRSILDQRVASPLTWRLASDRLAKRAGLVMESERRGVREVDREIIRAGLAKPGATQDSEIRPK